MAINDILIPDSIALVDNKYTGKDRDRYKGQSALTGRFLMNESHVPDVETSLQHFARGGSPFVREAYAHLSDLREDFFQYLLREGYNASTMEKTVFVPINISKGAPSGLEHLFQKPHYLKFELDVGFPDDDISNPSFRISPSKLTDLHPKRSGRATGTGFYEIARGKSNDILVAYAHSLKQEIIST